MFSTPPYRLWPHSWQPGSSISLETLKLLCLASICRILMGRRVYTGKSESVTAWDMWNRCFAKFELRPKSIVLIRHWSLCIITHAQGTCPDRASCLSRLLSREPWNRFHCNENHCCVCSLEMQWIFITESRLAPSRGFGFQSSYPCIIFNCYQMK